MLHLSFLTKRTFFAAVLFACVAGAPSIASAASLNLITDKETFVIGDTFSIDVKVKSTDVGVNAAQATITFPEETVQVTGVDKSGSVFDFWLQGPEYSNDTGEVSFIGGSQAGVSGGALEVLRVTFTVKGAGPVAIIFSDGAVTASDGSGTNVLTAMNGLELTSITTQDAALIKPPQIERPVIPAVALPSRPAVSVPLYPDSDAWYADITKFIARWELPRDVTAVATEVNQQPAFNPTASEGLFDNKAFRPLSDGVWYLHVRFKNTAGWGATAHYRIAIDSTPPVGFEVLSPGGFTTGNVAPTIHFETKDQPSGVDVYEVYVDGVPATTTPLASYTLAPQSAGDHEIIVRALDQTGNATESRKKLSISEEPLITIGGFGVTKNVFFISVIVAILLGGAAGWFIGRREKEQQRRRIVIAQRDVQTVLGLIEKDIDALMRHCEDGCIAEQEVHEMRATLERARDTIEKNKRYVVQNIEEIQQ